MLKLFFSGGHCEWPDSGLVNSNSTWKMLHVEETGKNTFNTMNLYMESLTAGKQKISNPEMEGYILCPPQIQKPNPGCTT